jgi:methyl-accepting chemotaxis protein
MRWLISDPILILALMVVVGWCATAIAVLGRMGEALSTDLASFTRLVSTVPTTRDDADLDASVPAGSELPVLWRRIKAARFTSSAGGLVLSHEPTDLIGAHDLLEPTRWYRFCSSTANYLVGLGLGFTFLGLVLALNSIDPQNLSDPAQLTRLFAAMKFKFIASMARIFTSILFSVLFRLYLSRVQHLMAALQTALAVRYPVVDPVVNALGMVSADLQGVQSRLNESSTLASRTADATERSLDIWGDVVEQLKTATTQLKQFNDELSISIGNVLEERFEQKLLPPISDALKALERAVLGVRDAQTSTGTEMMTGMVEQFQKAVSGGTAHEVAAITATLGQLNDSLTATKSDLQGVGRTIESNIVSGLRSATSELTNSVETLSRKLADTVAAASGALTTRLDVATSDAGSRFATAADRLDTLLRHAQGTVDAGTQSAETTERILARFSEIAARFDQAQVGFSRIADPVQRTSERLDTVADRVRQASEAIERSAQQTQSIEERVAASWTRASERFEDVDAGLARIFTELNAGLSSYASTVNEFNGTLTREFTNALGSLQGIVGELNDTLQDMQAHVNQAVQ